MIISVESVKELLPSLGYEPSAKDSPAIRFALERAMIHVKDFCNISYIPDDLVPEVINMACGEFLYQKVMTGTADDGGLKFPSRVSQITEGDTSVSFSGAGKDQENYLNFLDQLRRGDPYILEHNRVVQWNW